MSTKPLFLSLIVMMFSCPAWCESNSESGVLDEAVGSMIDDIKRYGPDALMFGEDFVSTRDYEQAFAIAYDASVEFLAYGVKVEAETEKTNVKCGLRLDRHDTQLQFRRNDILRGEASEYETGAKFYLSVTKEW